jgi:hypothetical protein
MILNKIFYPSSGRSLEERKELARNYGKVDGKTEENASTEIKWRHCWKTKKKISPT